MDQHPIVRMLDKHRTQRGFLPQELFHPFLPACLRTPSRMMGGLWVESLGSVAIQITKINIITSQKSADHLQLQAQ